MNETQRIDCSAPLAAGTELKGGDYRIISTLGRGGFGVTYLAEQTGMQRKVCIKEFFPKDYYRRDEDTSHVVLEADSFGPMMERFKDKFLKEARTIARFKHPNIIAIYDIFEENDTAYYVMEYIEGRSLKSLVVANGALGERDAVGYITQVASALEYVHSRNTVHLDVKPDNVMLSDEDGSAVLIDFGLSKHYDGAGEQTSTTPVGISRGYAPMEQYQTAGVTTFRPATDIYSLGATLFTLVTGAVPPEASVVNEEGLPTLPKSLSAGVRSAIERSMQSRIKDRPQTITEFMSLLNGGGKGVAGGGGKRGGEEVLPERPKKKSKWWLWLLLLVIVAGGAAAWFMSGPKDEPTPTPEPAVIVADTIEEVDSTLVEEIVSAPILRLTSDNTITLSHSGGNGSIRYTLENPVSGVNISVSDNASWLTTSRSGNTISYSASANESQSSRTATITVRYGDQSFEVVITQNGKPAPTYAVGDYYNVNGVEGVVFEISDGGRHGKIVSVDQAALVWGLYGVDTPADSETNGKANTDAIMALENRDSYQAFTWCRGKGSNWYLPANSELQVISSNIYAINTTLRERGYTEISNRWYWSSTEASECYAWTFRMNDGSPDYGDKRSPNYVLAVSAF